MLTRLSISQFRTLGIDEPLVLTLGRYNLVIGANGSGKTSLLEAIFLLANGKSFREHRPKNYISHGMDQCTVFATLDDGDSVAISKDSEKTIALRHNSQPLPNQTALAKKLPTLVLDPVATGLLDEGSELRRGLLDWLCFYSDARFYGQWQSYKTVLKQRNKALKGLQKNPSALNRQAIKAWDYALSEHAHQLDQIRQNAFNDWQEQIKQTVALLLPKQADDLSISYHAGFDSRRALGDILAQRLSGDIQLGYTSTGAHRADIHVLISHEQKAKPASQILSRGEKKLLIIALKLAQLSLVCQYHKPIVLLDDIGAELDIKAQERLLSLLAKLPCQLVITSLDPQLIAYLPSDIAKALCCFNIQKGGISA